MCVCVSSLVCVSEEEERRRERERERDAYVLTLPDYLRDSISFWRETDKERESKGEIEGEKGR